MKRIDTSQFRDMPMTILRDRRADGRRIPLVSINNEVLPPSNKRLLRSLGLQKDKEVLFSRYHFHEAVEILKIDKGVANIVINEERFFLQQGDIAVINPFEAHSIYLPQPEGEFIRTCFVFRPTDLFLTRKNSDLPFFDMLSNTCFQNIIPADHAIGKELGGYVDNIIRLSEQRSDGWQVAVCGQLMLFYAAMIREGCRKQRSDALPYQFEFMTKMAAYVEENLGRSLSTEQAAEYCLYSVEHFCRLFKSCFNRTFKEYLNICRIQKAMAIIDTGTYKSLGEVGALVGFNNANHFSNTFKKLMGITPSQYANEGDKDI